MGNNLTRRVQDANPGNGGNAGKEVAEMQRQIGAQITKMKEQFQAAMPKGMEATQLIRDALTALRTQRNLPQCDELSVLGGLMTFAQLGLRPHVPSLGHGWLLPFWDKHSRGFKAQVVIGYKGYAALAYRTGGIASLVGREVRQEDFFDVEYGLDERLAHKPARPGPRGEVTDYYTIVRYTGGNATFWHMTKTEAEEHRDQYAMAREYEWVNGKRGAPKLRPDGGPVITGPWRDHFDAMAIKTTFLKLARWMPKSTELEAAIAADESVRYDLSGDSLDSLFHGEKANGDFVDGEVVPDEEPPSAAVAEPPTHDTPPAAGEPPAQEKPPAEPSPTKAMLTKLHTLLSELGVTDRGDRLTTVATLVQRSLGSTNELTKAEAMGVIDLLERVSQDKDDPGKALDAVLASLDTPAGGGQS